MSYFFLLMKLWYIFFNYDVKLLYSNGILFLNVAISQHIIMWKIVQGFFLYFYPNYIYNGQVKRKSHLNERVHVLFKIL